MEWVLIIGVIAAASGGFHFLRDQGRRLSSPTITVVLAAITASFSIAGNLAPDVLATLGRDGAALTRGQWWRLLTPLVVQDGGWAGTAFNLVTLVVVGTLTETIFGKRVLVTVYLLAGIASEIAGYTILPNQGYAGNSVANLGLTALCLVTFVAAPRARVRVFGTIGMVAGAVLIATANLHGVGFGVGALSGVILLIHGRADRSRGPWSPGTTRVR